MRFAGVVVGVGCVIGSLGCGQHPDLPKVPPVQTVESTPDKLWVVPDFPPQPLGAEVPLGLEDRELGTVRRDLGRAGEDASTCTGDVGMARKVADFGPALKYVAAISPEGRHVVAWNGGLTLADTRTGRLHAIPSVPLAYSVDGERILFDVSVGVPAHTRSLQELDVGTGAWTNHVSLGTEVGTEGPRIIADRAVVAISKEGAVWKYDLVTREASLLSQRTTSRFVRSAGELIAFWEDATMVLHDVRSSATRRFPDIAGVHFLGSSGAVVLVTTGRSVRGWSPSGGEVTLHAEPHYPTNVHEGGAYVDARPLAGTSRWIVQLPPLLMIWDVDTAEVRQISKRANGGWSISGDGKQVAFGSAWFDHVCTLLIAPVAGGEPTPFTSLRGEDCGAVLNHDATRAMVRGLNFSGEGEVHPRFLFALDDLRQVPLEPSVTGDYHLFFAPNGIPATYVHGQLQLYDADTGARRYTVLLNSGGFTFGAPWVLAGADGVLYPGVNAPQALIAWDPRTSVETVLAIGATNHLCFSGGRNVFQRGIEYGNAARPSELVSWDASTRRLRRYSNAARSAACSGDADSALVIEDGTPTLQRLTLIDFARDCRQPLSWILASSGDLRTAAHVTTDGGLIFARPDGVWRVDLPQLAR